MLEESTDIAPRDCQLCVQGANKILKACVPGAPGFKDKCKAWVNKQRKIACFNENYSRFSTICGHKGLNYMKLSPGKKPANCSEQKPEICGKEARDKIESQFEACQNLSDKIADKC